MALLVDRFKRPRTLAVIGVVVVLIVLSYVGALKPIEGISNTLLRPFQAVAVAITRTVEHISVPFSSVVALAERNQVLEQEKNQLLSELADTRQQLALQEILVQQFGYLNERHFTYVPAKIIGKTIDPTFDSLIVTIGNSTGVAVGQAVVIDQGIFIGTVRSVEAQHVEILLLNDNRSVIDAAISGEHETPGVVTGQFSTNVTMELIPQGSIIAPNDIVITRADGKGIPSGLIIGKVVKVENNPGQLFQNALVAPAAAIEKASVVSIITGQQ